MLLSSRFIIFFIVALFSTNGIAQSETDTLKSDRATQLDIVQSVLDAKLSERKLLRERLIGAGTDDLADLEIELKEINTEIAELRESFEQIAVGSVDLSVFNTDVSEFDWRTEMTQVMMPIIRNLQSLTEKPRKMEALRSQIQTNNEQVAAAQEALSTINENLSRPATASTQASLTTLRDSWQEKIQEIARNTGVAEVKLTNLQKNDGNFLQTAKSGIIGFFTGRGLTLLIAATAAAAVWYVAKFLTKFLLARSKGEAAKTYRTRQRLVQYAFNILTALLMTIAVIVVFYIRGDVLLLGLSVLLVGAAILGLRNTIPRFISEARLLLNLGSIREDERVVYNGLPYRVTALNVYSVLKNPELTGVIRLPLEQMMGMISRPAGKEAWFPASKGDFIMLPDGRLLEVLDMTTELVQLQNLAGTKTSVPAADFYNMTFDNLTRGDNIAITSTFGVGYSHQDISNKRIPTTLQKAVTKSLAATDFADQVISVAIELKEAGASSLDYWICVTLSSKAARAYYKTSRIVQQSCVDTCTAENWDIPFPQLTIHNQ